jgi:hypothetical protein
MSAARATAKLQWHKVHSVSTMHSTLSVWMYGPCLRFGYHVGGGQIKYIYAFRDKRFHSEAQLIRHVDYIAKSHG